MDMSRLAVQEVCPYRKSIVRYYDSFLNPSLSHTLFRLEGKVKETLYSTIS